MSLYLNKGPVVVHNRNLALSGIEKQESFNMRNSKNLTKNKTQCEERYPKNKGASLVQNKLIYDFARKDDDKLMKSTDELEDRTSTFPMMKDLIRKESSITRKNSKRKSYKNK